MTTQTLRESIQQAIVQPKWWRARDMYDHWDRYLSQYLATRTSQMWRLIYRRAAADRKDIDLVVRQYKNMPLDKWDGEEAMRGKGHAIDGYIRGLSCARLNAQDPSRMLTLRTKHGVPPIGGTYWDWLISLLTRCPLFVIYEARFVDRNEDGSLRTMRLSDGSWRYIGTARYAGMPFSSPRLCPHYIANYIEETSSETRLRLHIARFGWKGNMFSLQKLWPPGEDPTGLPQRFLDTAYSD